MEEKIRFPRYLHYGDDNMLTILGYLGNVTTFVDNRGYVDKDTEKVYVYNPKNKHVPYIIVSDDGEVTKVDTDLKVYDEYFKLSNSYENSIYTILSTTPKDAVLYDEEALADMNAATSVFVPEIQPDDDPLKKIIKSAIINKGIDINRLKCKLPEKYALTNLKSALIGKTKMSISVFQTWCGLLELDFTFTVSDNGNDGINPLLEPITISTIVGLST